MRGRCACVEGSYACVGGWYACEREVCVCWREVCVCGREVCVQQARSHHQEHTGSIPPSWAEGVSCKKRCVCVEGRYACVGRRCACVRGRCACVSSQKLHTTCHITRISPHTSPQPHGHVTWYIRRQTSRVITSRATHHTCHVGSHTRVTCHTSQLPDADSRPDTCPETRPG